MFCVCKSLRRTRGYAVMPLCMLVRPVGALGHLQAGGAGGAPVMASYERKGRTAAPDCSP